MAPKFEEYQDNLGRNFITVTTAEGLSYNIGPMEHGGGVAWIKAFDGPSEAHTVVAEPPPGKSLAIVLVGLLSSDLLAVNAHWYIRNPDGSYTGLGDTDVAAGQNANVLLYDLTTFVTIHDKGALCVTTYGLNDNHGVAAVGWII